MTTRTETQTSTAALFAGAAGGFKTLFTDREAAAYLGASKSTVWRWAAEGVIPRPIRIGGCSRWKLADLEAVIARAEAQREPVAA